MQLADKKQQVLVDDKVYYVMSIRKGGMGQVWLLERAFDEPFDPIYQKRIAVKTFDFVKDKKSVEHELNIWISLEHHSVLPLKKIGRLNYRLAAIMSLLDGSLNDLIEKKGKLTEQETIKIISDIVDALDYSWSTFKILHLDLKPSNVLVEQNTPIRIKIADWGISRLAAENRQIREFNNNKLPNTIFARKTAYLAGTLLFMAPERFSGNWMLSPITDIYSLGMMAIQLNTGKLPFSFGTINPVEEIRRGIFFENAYEMLKNSSKSFRHFCLHCIHPNPSKRPSTFHRVATQLNSIS